MDAEVLRAINNLSKRVNKIEKNLEKFLLDKQEITNGGLADIADIISIHDEAITDLASLVSEIAEKEA